MSGKYKVGEDAIPHFVIFSVVRWVDVFSKEQYKELFVESLKYCQQNKGLVLHALAPIAIRVTDHVHLIISSNNNIGNLSVLANDLQRY